MSDNHDPGDEHRDPWPFYCPAKPFEVSASDDLSILWIGRATSEHPASGWYTAVAGIDRTTGRQAIAYADGRVEDITELVREVYSLNSSSDVPVEPIVHTDE